MVGSKLFKVEAEDGEIKYFQIFGEEIHRATAQMVCESAVTLAISEELDSGGFDFRLWTWQSTIR